MQLASARNGDSFLMHIEGAIALNDGNQAHVPLDLPNFLQAYTEYGHHTD